MKKKKIIILSICISFVTVLACVLVNIFAFYLPEKKIREEHEKLAREYYQNKLAIFEEENQTISHVDIVFLGDSLTDGYDVKNYYSEYTALNRGIGGDTTFGLEKRLQVSAYDINPKVVCMLIGGNNLSTMFENYEQIIIKLKENLPDSKIVLLSLTAMGENFASKNKIAIENNQHIKSLAAYYQCEFVDLFTPLYDYQTEKIKDGLTVDGVHFNAAGYEIVTNQVKPVIKSLIG